MLAGRKFNPQSPPRCTTGSRSGGHARASACRAPALCVSPDALQSQFQLPVVLNSELVLRRFLARQLGQTYTHSLPLWLRCNRYVQETAHQPKLPVARSITHEVEHYQVSTGNGRGAQGTQGARHHGSGHA